MRIPRAIVLPLVGGLVWAASAAAVPFDVIYSDHILFLIPPGGTGVTTTGDFMLLVNKDGRPISAAALAGVHIFAKPVIPSVRVDTPIDVQSGFAAVQPDEAVGALGESGGGFAARLLPGETLRDTQPHPLFGLVVDPGGYPSPVACEFTVSLGSDLVVFIAHLHLIPGDPSVTYLTTTRISSSRPVSAHRGSWARVKALFR